MDARGCVGVQGVRGTSKNAISLKEEPSSLGASSLMRDALNFPCNALELFPVTMWDFSKFNPPCHLPSILYQKVYLGNEWICRC